MIKLKSIIYKTGINCLRMFWRIKGRRNIKAFGEDYHVMADTIFPNYRKFRLPKKGCLSEIVRYTDYVQLHSVVNYVMQLKNQPTIIDIGAHHGAYAVILGKIVQKRGGKVIAVEPNPESFAILEQNVRLNGLEDTVICERVAVGDAAGFMGLEKSGTQSHLIREGNLCSCSVEVVPLARLFSKYNVKHVDLLMIDVEGAELSVLRGFPWQSIGVGKILCELHPYAWRDFGYNGKDFQNFLSEINFRCFDMYLHEHVTFNSDAYIGPTLLIPAK